MWNFRLRSFLGGIRDEQEKGLVPRRGCDVEGCPELGDYKAPKSRDNMRSYHWFCLDHVREYNQNWDFFKGMTPGEIDVHMRKAIVGDRPSWKMTKAGANEETRMRQKIYEHFTSNEGVYGDFASKGEAEEEEAPHIHATTGLSHPTLEALTTIGLKPPVVWEDISKRYKKLAKKYHPDHNQNDKEAEEQLKKINMAYTILKLSYQSYTDLKEK